MRLAEGWNQCEKKYRSGDYESNCSSNDSRLSHSLIHLYLYVYFISSLTPMNPWTPLVLLIWNRIKKSVSKCLVRPTKWMRQLKNPFCNQKEGKACTTGNEKIFSITESKGNIYLYI